MINIVILVESLLFLLTSYMIVTKSTSICVVISNIISATIVFIYCILQAPDIAITEAVIGTATNTILFMLALLFVKKIPTNKTQNTSYNIDIGKRMCVLIICLIFGLLLIYAIQSLPKIQIYDIINQQRISKLYIKNAIKDFGFSSIVTAVVAGYRAFDTMFENVVIFTACYGFYVLITMNNTQSEDEKSVNEKINYNNNSNTDSYQDKTINVNINSISV